MQNNKTHLEKEIIQKKMMIDQHGVKNCRPKCRKVIAMYYGNTLHNHFYCIEGCHTWEKICASAGFVKKQFY